MTRTRQRLIPAPPISPGYVLRTHILPEIGITQEQLAISMQVSRFSINQIINGRRAVTAEMAVRLGRVTGTTPEFWLNLQRDVDLYQVAQKLSSEIEQLTPLRHPATEAEMFEDAQ
jgi:addiction module HigA family antidote